MKKIKVLKEDIKNYQDQLDSLHLRDAYFTCGITTRQIALLLFQQLLGFLFVLPIAFVGALLHSPIYLIAKFVGSTHVTPYTESKAMLKLGVSVFFSVPLIYSLTLLAVYQSLGSRALLTALLLLPIFGLAHVWILEQGILLGKSILPLMRLMLVMCLGFKPVLQKIEKERLELVNRINEVMKAYNATIGISSPLQEDRNRKKKRKKLNYDIDEHFI